MRVLLDECVPHRLRRLLVGHQAISVEFVGWKGVRNGALLALMAAHGFEALLTVDRSLQFQQNLPEAGVMAVVMVAASNSVRDLAPLMPKVLAALANLKPGEVVEVVA